MFTHLTVVFLDLFLNNLMFTKRTQNLNIPQTQHLSVKLTVNAH